jgi:hypothetical protein
MVLYFSELVTHTEAYVNPIFIPAQRHSINKY